MRAIAYGISAIFHPLLMPTYMLVLLLAVNPYLFGINSISEPLARLILLQVFLYTFFLPVAAVVLMRMLGLVSDFDLQDRHERIGPYLLTGMLYLWVFYNFRNSSQIPTAYTIFLLGSVISLFIAFFINIFSKISAHAVGMGGLVAMVIATMIFFSYHSFGVHLGNLGSYQVSLSLVLLSSILVAGLVGSSRLLLQAHEPMDLYGGYLVGFAAQVIAIRFFF